MEFVSVNDRIVSIAQIARKCPGATLRRAYTRALREWCQQTQWLRVNLPGFTTAAVETYNLGDDINLDVIGVRAVSVTKTVNGVAETMGLAASDPVTWDPNQRAGMPRGYAYLAESRIALYPTPDTVYTLLISLVVVPKESGDIAAQVPRDPLTKYSNDIESGALAYLLSIPGQPWSNPAQAEMWQRKFQSAISNGKAEVQRTFNTGSMRVRPRTFLR